MRKPFPAALHHISTLSVFPPVPGTVARESDELEDLGAVKLLFEGYAQSKWVAEKKVLAARERGLPCTIFRLGRITGGSSTGLASVEDFMCRLIKGCLQLNAAPDLGWPLDMNPADYVAQVICELSLVKSNKGRIFHICHPRMMKLQNYFQWLHKSFGYTALRIIGYEKWRETLVQEIAALSEGGVAIDQVCNGGDLPCLPHRYFCK